MQHDGFEFCYDSYPCGQSLCAHDYWHFSTSSKIMKKRAPELQSLPWLYSCSLWGSYVVQYSNWSCKQRITWPYLESLPPQRDEARWQQLLADWVKLLSELLLIFSLSTCSSKPFSHCSHKRKKKGKTKHTEKKTNKKTTHKVLVLPNQGKVWKTNPGLQIIKTACVSVEENKMYSFCWIGKALFLFTDYYVF